MFCQKCGSQMEDTAVFCPTCGAAVNPQPEQTRQQTQQTYQQPGYNQYQQPGYNQYQQPGYNQYQQPGYNQYQPGYNQQGYYNPPESSTIAILALVFGCLGGWLGILFGIIGLCTYKTPAHRTKCIIGIVIACAWILIMILLIATGILFGARYYY